MKVDIRSSDYDYNMAPWLAEKSQYILEGLVAIYEDFRKKDNLPNDLMDILTTYLSGIFYDATKILSFASGGEWSISDRSIIIEKGKKGLEEVLVSYGLLEETTEEKTKRQTFEKVENLVNKLKELLKEPRYEARPRIHKLLLKEGFDDTIVNQISDLTEDVTMGELPWDRYIKLCQTLLNKLEQHYLSPPTTL